MGKLANRRSFAGHHVGIYGQALVYDFEWGGRGYQSAKWSYGVGVSYGYSLPIADQFRLDFTLGVGYLDGRYKEYLPQDNHYVWQKTKKRHWFGPTKAEISFVWVIGERRNSQSKGGSR